MKIKVYVKRPDEKIGHSTWISNTLENLQKTVEGYIETVTFGDYVVICNEERSSSQVLTEKSSATVRSASMNTKDW